MWPIKTFSGQSAESTYRVTCMPSYTGRALLSASTSVLVISAQLRFIRGKTQKNSPTEPKLCGSLVPIVNFRLNRFRKFWKFSYRSDYLSWVRINTYKLACPIRFNRWWEEGRIGPGTEKRCSRRIGKTDHRGKQCFWKNLICEQEIRWGDQLKLPFTCIQEPIRWASDIMIKNVILPSLCVEDSNFRILLAHLSSTQFSYGSTTL